MSAPTFAIVTPVYNSMQHLAEVLRTFEAAAELSGATVVAVDNGSTDGSWELLLERRGPRLKVVRLPDATIAAVRNRGAAETGAEVLAFIDSDCLIEPAYLERAAEVLERTEAAATGSRHELPVRPGWLEKSWHDLHRRSGDGWINYIPSGNFVVRRSAFEEVGGWDEDLVTGEDAEICQRLAQAGHGIYSSSVVMARHLGNPKTLRMFARKEYWHGLGMFGTFRGDPLDKPVLLTFLHLAAVVGAAVVMVWGGWRGVLPGLVLAEVAPALAVGFRWVQARRIVRPLRSLILYTVYLWGRVAALLAVGWGALRGRRPA